MNHSKLAARNGQSSQAKLRCKAMDLALLLQDFEFYASEAGDLRPCLHHVEEVLCRLSQHVARARQDVTC